ncbi:MAG: hypothetical protein L3K26_07705 [Candidatus Hydrogenedentes bacterium]|nr:hypothetical protein [Candidatus Hydrogenedentota bacterium]
MKKALLILWLFALTAISQSTNITGIPDGVTVFTITLEGGGELHGAIEKDGSFIAKFQKDNDNSLKSVTVIKDTPGDPGKKKRQLEQNCRRTARNAAEARNAL